jgi:hypothetical protein
MRIPSSFTDDNLYRQRGRRSVGNSPQRRLLRLLLAMALVIAVMRQAGNPRIYELFFSAPPNNVDTAAAGALGSGHRVVTIASTTAGRSDEPAAETLPLDRTVAALDEATIKQLIATLADERRRVPTDQHDRDTLALPPDLIQRLNQAAQSAGDIGPSADIERSDIDPPDMDWSDGVLVQRLQAALDRWAIDRLDPGAIWKDSDTLAFYRLLEDPAPAWLRQQTAAGAGVTSLLQQPEIYLHGRVTLPGSVARAIRRDAAVNPFGVSEYWELWLRPRDGSEQPLVFFTASVPEEIARIDATASLPDGPPVWVDGLFIKRLAYQSAEGRQLTPAIVGSLFPMQSSQAAQPAITAQPGQSPSQPSIWTLLALSALVGITISLLIYYQTRKAALRMRALRQSAGLPVRLADSLSENNAPFFGSRE